MAAISPSYVRNIIIRSFREIVDPSPSKQEEREIWEFFDSKCAYCGKPISEKKQGHIDHLMPSSLDGQNNISNRVLSCATCNESEKRDMIWVEFLLKKNSTEYQFRSEKIHEWQKIHNERLISKELTQQIEQLSKRVILSYDIAIAEARKLASQCKL